MKKVYIQIIDPINGTTLNASHEYSDEYNNIVERTLRQYGLTRNESYEATSSIGKELPGMPDYLLIHGIERGTSKIVNITVIE